MMKENDIRKYAELMKELELTGLEINEDKNTIRLERNVAATQNITPACQSQNIPKVENDDSTPKDYISITSPMVGMFYAAPAEDAAPFVSVGDTVKKGQTLCIIEAMKLMNEITASEDGVISEICITNGGVVEFGTELFRIKR